MSEQLTKTKYKQTEVGLIPEDWNVKSLNELALEPPKYGIGAPAVEFNYNLPTYLRITDIGENGKLIRTGLKSVCHNESSNYILQEGDLVLARTGASVGKSYLFDTKDGQLVYAGFLIKISPDPSLLDSLYLRCFLNTRTYWNWVSVNSMRSGQPGINGYEYGSLPLPLPPTLHEQKAIATALSDVDALISSLEKLIAKKKAIKQGAMQELLTPPQKGGKRLPGFSGEWEEKYFSEIADVRDGTHDSPKYVDNGIKFITSKNIVNNKLSFSDVSLISEKDAVEINKRSKVDKGDILMSMIGTIGSAVLIEIEPDFCIKNVALFKPYICRINTSFLFQKLTSPSYQQYILGKLDGGIQKFISLGMLRNLKIELPSQIEEQKAIAQILSDMDLEIEGLEAKKAKYQGIKQGMMQELLTGKTRLV